MLLLADVQLVQLTQSEEKPADEAEQQQPPDEL